MEGGDVSPLIENSLSILRGSVESVSVVGRESIARGFSPDLLVVAQSASGAPGKAACGTLLAPNFRGAVGRNLKAEKVISYGLSTRDSLTLSSIGRKKMVLSLQRELTALNGRVLERQDIPVQVSAGRSPEDVLASVSALLLLGAAPEFFGAIIL